MNLLHLEALAVAGMLRATICVWEGDESRHLASAADAVGVPLVSVPL